MNKTYLCAAAVCLSAAAAQAQERKPNILLIFSDQHRADVFGWTGHPDAITPNFDRMARQGVAFTRAYCQDAVSVPSRTSLFTGLYPRTTGVLDNSKAETEALRNVVSLQSLFQANGYDTYAFGKRHLSGKPDQGWTLCREHNGKVSTDYNYVEWIGRQGYAQEFGEDWAAEFGEFPEGNELAGTVYPRAQMATRPTKLPEEYTMEAFSARNTIDMIREHGQNGKPFLCFTSFYRPHQPYTALSSYLANYDASQWGTGTVNGGSIAMPATLHQPTSELPPALARLRASEKGIWCLGLAAKNEQLYRDYMAAYYALVQEIDHWVGEIFEALEQSGQAENTIVVYTSDHGDFVGDHGMVEKCAMGHNVYEQTLCVPMLFYWKGHTPEGYVCSDLAGLIDLYPTLAEMAGLKIPETYHPQGLSLAQAVLDKKPIPREYIVSENWSQATVITRDAKLGIWLDPTPVNRDFREFGDMLFLRANDPEEVHNAIGEPVQQQTVEKLYEYYRQFVSQIPDTGKEQMKKIITTKGHKPQRIQ